MSLAPPVNGISQLVAHRPIRPDAPTEAIDSSRCAGLGDFYFDGLHLGGISSEHGIPFFSEQGREWICERVGSAPAIRPHRTYAGSRMVDGHRRAPRGVGSSPIGRL